MKVLQSSKDIRASKGVARGQVRIGMLASLSGLFVTPLLTRIRDEIPEVKVHVVEGLSEHIEEWLAAGRVDIGILYGERRKRSSGDEYLMSADLHLAGSPGTAAVMRREVAFREITQLPMILPAPPNFWRLSVERACAVQKTSLNIAIELDSIQTIKDLVAAGKGYTLITLHAARAEIEAGLIQVSKVVEPVITREIFLATSTEHPYSRASLEVSKLIREVLTELVHSGVIPGRLQNSSQK